MTAPRARTAPATCQDRYGGTCTRPVSAAAHRAGTGCRYHGTTGNHAPSIRTLTPTPMPTPPAARRSTLPTATLAPPAPPQVGPYTVTLTSDPHTGADLLHEAQYGSWDAFGQRPDSALGALRHAESTLLDDQVRDETTFVVLDAATGMKHWFEGINATSPDEPGAGWTPPPSEQLASAEADLAALTDRIAKLRAATDLQDDPAALAVYWQLLAADQRTDPAELAVVARAVAEQAPTGR